MMKPTWRSGLRGWYLFWLLSIPVAAATNGTTTVLTSTSTSTVTATTPMTTPTTPTTTTSTATTPPPTTTTEATLALKSLASFHLSMFSNPDPPPVEQTCKRANMCESVPGICNKGTCSPRPCSTEIVCNCDHGMTGMYCDQNITDVFAANDVRIVNGKIVTTTAHPVKQHVNGNVLPYTIKQKVIGGTDENGNHGNVNGHHAPDNGNHDNGNNGQNDNGNGHYDNGGGRDGSNGRHSGSTAGSPKSVATDTTPHSASTADTGTISTLVTVTSTNKPVTTTVDVTPPTVMSKTQTSHVTTIQSPKSPNKVTPTTSSTTMSNTIENKGTKSKLTETTIEMSHSTTTHNALDTNPITSSATTLPVSTSPPTDGSYRKGPESFIFADNSPIHMETPVQTLRHENHKQSVVAHTVETIKLPRATMKIIASSTVFPSNVRLGQTHTTEKNVVIKHTGTQVGINTPLSSNNEKQIPTNNSVTHMVNDKLPENSTNTRKLEQMPPEPHSKITEPSTSKNTHTIPRRSNKLKETRTKIGTIDTLMTDVTSKVKLSKEVKLTKITGFVDMRDKKDVFVTNTAVITAQSDRKPDTVNKTKKALVSERNSTKLMNERKLETNITTRTPTIKSGRNKIKDKAKRPTSIEKLSKPAGSVYSGEKTKRVTTTAVTKGKSTTDSISKIAKDIEKSIRETAALMKVSGTKKMSTSVFRPVIVNFLNIFQSPRFFSVLKSGTPIQHNSEVRGSGKGKTTQTARNLTTPKNSVSTPDNSITTHASSTISASASTSATTAASTSPSSSSQVSEVTSASPTTLSNDITTVVTHRTT